MFWNPNQTGQRKQKEGFLAGITHPQTAARKPANSNRKPKLLETLQLQQNKQPRVVLIAKRSLFSESILKNLPQTDSFQQPGQRAPSNRVQIRQARRKHESAPLSFVAIKRRTNRLFSGTHEAILISPCGD
jgi:hypothetical protein